jgi:hypothetical protein
MLSIDQMIDQAFDQAKRVLIGSATDQIIPTFVIQFKDRPSALIAAPWESDQEKAATFAAMRAALQMYRSSVVNYSFLTEAWVAIQDHPYRPGDLEPSKRESRKECVLAGAFGHDGGRMQAWEILRDDEGRVTELVAEKGTKPDWEGGRAYNLMEEEA